MHPVLLVRRFLNIHERKEVAMRRKVSPGGGLPLAFLLVLPLLLGGCSREGPAGEAYAALETEFSAVMDSVETMEVYRKVVGEFRSRFEHLAQEYWGTAGALDAQLWLMRYLSIEVEDRQARAAALEEMTEKVMARYARSSHLEILAQLVSLYTEEQRVRYFADVQEHSPHANVRAAFLYAAARNADFELTYGGDDVDRAAMGDLRRTNLERLVADYGDLPLRNTTYGVAAEAMLSAYDPADLEIGKPAPEIVGTNVDGEEMRLSDFRGKVVVLDFWGDW
jgi:hypothetical protein